MMLLFLVTRSSQDVVNLFSVGVVLVFEKGNEVVPLCLRSGFLGSGLTHILSFEGDEDDK